MRSLFFIIFSYSFVALSIAQSDTDAALLLPIEQLFDGMRAGDSMAVKDAFMPNAIVESIVTKKDGNTVIQKGSAVDFARAVGTPHPEIWDEKIWSYDIRQNAYLSTVWTEYTFYVGKKRSHCGVNAFTLFKTPKGWKISHIIDTRRLDNCQESPDSLLHQIMDNWHHAAATGDEKVFFGSMGPAAIYIGTDATERWPKAEFESWAARYFERDTAWAFQPIEREIYYSSDGNVAWFDETLDTWMGVCRGSGILEKTALGWKMQHYHLAIAVPNEKVKGYLELLKKE